MTIRIDQPKVTNQRAGRDHVWRTCVMGAIPAGYTCATCGTDKIRLHIFTIGYPAMPDANWWRTHKLFCSLGCWIAR